MKKTLMLSSLLVVCIMTTNAQSKKELEKNLKAATAERDSIQQAYTALLAKTDSINNSQVVADVVAPAVVDTSMELGSESMAKKNDSSAVTTTSDSTKATNKGNEMASTPRTSGNRADSLRNENEHLKYIINQYLGKGTIPRREEDLTGLWALSLQYFKVTDDSSKSGLLNIPAPPESRAAVRIIFIDYELAEITFSNGETSKCFYKVNSFSNDQPYSIDFSKGTIINSRLQVNPTASGELQVSYKRGNGYYSGYMRKM